MQGVFGKSAVPAILVVLLIALSAAPPVRAEADWIDFETAAAGTVSALFAKPEGDGPFAAIVYNHGRIVRKLGYAEAAVRGYDVKDFVEKLAAAGYVVIAPIRDRLEDAGPEEAVSGGVAVSNGAIDFLKGRSDVNAERIGVMGFSEGGLITIWTALKRDDLAAVVLMSPAVMGRAGNWSFKRAAREDYLTHITAPVFLTMGRDDSKRIKKNAFKRLIPRMESLGKDFSYRTDYPGDHRWFWEPRAAYFNDILEFLNDKLSP